MAGTKHNAVFDDVLAGMEGDLETKSARPGTRFLKRSTSIGETLAGEREEKVLHWVDPESCRMWARHNREYSLLNAENCADLIDGIRAQGQQEFPAVVRRLEGESHAYEVICGARRHFAVSWLRANNYPQFRYLVEVRDLTDEEAFRLADIENRDRDDISDFERARDYAQAIELYYGGKQKAMAARLEVSEPWLSRQLQLAKLPAEIVTAFASIRDIRELHARGLKPLLKDDATRPRILAEAARLSAEQDGARAGQGAAVDAVKVMTRLKVAARPKTPKPALPARDVTVRRKGNVSLIEVPDGLTREELDAALAAFAEGYMTGKT